MDDAVGEVIGAGVEAVGELVGVVADPGIGGSLGGGGGSGKPYKLISFFSVLFVGCLSLGFFELVKHFDYMHSPRFSRLTFQETPDGGYEAELLVERQVSEFENLFNIPDSISGPTPALKIQEDEVSKSKPRTRELSFRVVESAIGLPLRFRVISVEEPHEDSGLRDLIRLLPDDRVNAYLEAAAVELERHGYTELAAATRAGHTEVAYIDRSFFGSMHAISVWVFWGIAFIIFPFIIMAVMKGS